jgi:hypothetical protein
MLVMETILGTSNQKDEPDEGRMLFNFIIYKCTITLSKAIQKWGRRGADEEKINTNQTFSTQ